MGFRNLGSQGYYSQIGGVIKLINYSVAEQNEIVWILGDNGTESLEDGKIHPSLQ